MRKFSVSGTLAIVLVLAAALGIEFYVRSLGPRARVRLINEVGERFNADVTMGDLRLSLFPSPTVSGGPLSVRHRGWKDPHPLISISRFTAQSTFFSLLFQRDKVRILHLEGLEIHVPHRGKSTTRTMRVAHEEVESGQAGNDRSRLRIEIGTIVAGGTLLEIEPKQPGRDPLRFDIQKLEMHSVGASDPLGFDAVLRNPKPPGIINTSGQFGPWQKDDPRATAVSGKYRFEKANLAVFSGISGTLSSTGTYDGVLQQINIKGQTDVPDFALKRGGLPVHLTAEFQSKVNGMNGDTILENIDAHFLHSEFRCQGDVTRQGDDHGKTVSLFATTGQSARMEDILQLVIGHQTPLMTGNVQFESKILIPPGKQDVIDKLELQGRFKLTSAVFTSPEVNRKIAVLSLRARGISKGEQGNRHAPTVASNLQARFKLHNGSMSLSPLSFSVPGAVVRLNGSFYLPSQKLEFAGLFRMQATLSDTQSGVKHWLLKPLDPLFKKNGAGLELPFQVFGTQDHPTLSVSALHHTFKVN